MGVIGLSMDTLGSFRYPHVKIEIMMGCYVSQLQKFATRCTACLKKEPFEKSNSDLHIALL